MNLDKVSRFQGWVPTLNLDKVSRFQGFKVPLDTVEFSRFQGFKVPLKTVQGSRFAPFSRLNLVKVSRFGVPNQTPLLSDLDFGRVF